MLMRALMRLANTPLGYRLIRRLLNPTGLFLCYPVEPRFADHFCSRERQRHHAWSPYLIGVFRHGQSHALVFAVSSSEADLAAAEAVPRLRDLTDRMRAHADFFRTERVAYAGVLPTLLRARRLVRTGTEAEITCHAVGEAVCQVLASSQRQHRAIVVLGGKGLIGRSLIKHLNARAASADGAGLPPVVCVDKGDAWFMQGPALYVNCTLPGVIETMAALIPPGSTVLNEVYPAPPGDCVRALRSRDVDLFHVAGVQGRAWPAFPGEYHDAIPCCAALPNEPVQVALKRLH